VSTVWFLWCGTSGPSEGISRARLSDSAPMRRAYEQANLRSAANHWRKLDLRSQLGYTLARTAAHSPFACTGTLARATPGPLPLACRRSRLTIRQNGTSGFTCDELAIGIEEQAGRSTAKTYRVLIKSGDGARILRDSRITAALAQLFNKSYISWRFTHGGGCASIAVTLDRAGQAPSTDGRIPCGCVKTV
jgi:hypothetical protein